MNDPYVKLSKLVISLVLSFQQAYRSRASYKLLEIDQKFQLLRQGMKVIDVGAAPGGWSQVIAEKVESEVGKETVVAVDLLEIVPVNISLNSSNFRSKE